MNAKLSIFGFVAAVVWSATASAAIPEPDAILHGRVFIDGNPVPGSNTDVEIIGRVEVGGVEQEVGRYRMGDNADAGDQYILRVRLESLADGSTQSDSAALVGQTLRIYIKNGAEPGTLAGEFVISDRGLVQVLDLGGTCVIAGAFPPNCAIDARQPSKPDGSVPGGWDRIELTLEGCSPSSLEPGDFSVSVTGGTAPTIADFIPVDDTLTLVFDRKIPTAAWTRVTLNTTSTCIGSLPGDASGDGTSGPPDILWTIDCLNGVRTCEKWQCDADRSNICGPPDILRVIDLLNGAGVYDPWLNRSLPPCPSAP